MNVVIAQAYMPEIKNKDQRVDHSLWLWYKHKALCLYVMHHACITLFRQIVVEMNKASVMLYLLPQNRRFWRETKSREEIIFEENIFR